MNIAAGGNVFTFDITVTFQLHTVVRMDTTFPNSSTASSWEHPTGGFSHIIIIFKYYLFGNKLGCVSRVFFYHGEWVYVSVVLALLISGLHALWKPNGFICSPVLFQHHDRDKKRFPTKRCFVSFCQNYWTSTKFFHTSKKRVIFCVVSAVGRVRRWLTDGLSQNLWSVYIWSLLVMCGVDCWNKHLRTYITKSVLEHITNVLECFVVPTSSWLRVLTCSWSASQGQIFHRGGLLSFTWHRYAMTGCSESSRWHCCDGAFGSMRHTLCTFLIFSLSCSLVLPVAVSPLSSFFFYALQTLSMKPLYTV